MPLEYGPPSPDLLRELEEVSIKAKALAEHVRSANVLPKNFPHTQLEEICRNLIGLPSGTGEGCCVPLAYARKRIPAIRREYVPARSEISTDDESPPPVLRGENLDQLLKDLLAAVTTALDQYQVETGADIADAVDRENAVEGNSIPGVSSAAAQAQALEQRMNSASEALTDFNKNKSLTLDKLARQYKDVEIQSGLASTELKMPRVRVSWYQPIVAQLRKMPEVIEKTGAAIQVATDIAAPLLQRWNDFKANAWKHILHEIMETGKTLEQVGRRLKAARDNDASPIKTDSTEPPEGFDLTKARDMIASGIAPPASWTPWIDSLDFKGMHFRNFEILDNLSSLNTLDVSGSFMFGPTLVSGLSTLQRLIANGTPARDITPLVHLSQLKFLSLNNTSVSDLKPLAKLQNLQTLYLDATYIEDLSPLADIPALETLWIDGTRVTTLAPLKSAKSLKLITINQTSIKDLTPLAALDKLEGIYLASTPVNDLSSLRNLTALIDVDLSGTKVTDLTALSKNKSLKFFFLNKTIITDFGPLALFGELEVLALKNTKISDLSFLSRCPLIRDLELSETQIQDISSISNLPSLERLILDETAVSNLESLADLRELSQLSLNGTKVEDLGALSNLTKIRELRLDRTNVRDLTPLLGLSSLEEIWLDHTQVRDLSPLANHQALHTIWLNGTRVRDLSCLSNSRSLSRIVVGSEARRRRLSSTLKGHNGVVQVNRRQ